MDKCLWLTFLGYPVHQQLLQLLWYCDNGSKYIELCLEYSLAAVLR